jgi:hypothetical protein
VETSQNIPELVALARTSTKASVDRIQEVMTAMGGKAGTEAQVEDLRAATVSLELASVDIFSVFEARMQHNFKRGPFSRKLKALLLEAGQADLAEKFYQYYLAINVLKHGKGASHRELLSASNTLFDVKADQDVAVDEARPAAGLIDVTKTGFFDELTAVILEAYQFLEDR